jgi:hypothetical protein
MGEGEERVIGISQSRSVARENIIGERKKPAVLLSAYVAARRPKP